ncbi:MAG: tetratricopeptide repeat protein [Smithellaceae bacterium]|nr:tetratricopeptide repeat protein [Smithellaceae bacterium]
MILWSSVLLAGLALAQTKMIILYKDGKTQSIDVNSILKIEHQKTGPSPLSQDPTYHFQQGRSLQEQKHYAEASAAFSRAIALQPSHRDAYEARGWSRLSLKNYGGALTDSEQAIRIAPGDAGGYNLRGSARDGLGDYPGAAADFRKAIDLGFSLIQPRVKLSLVMSRMGNPAQALAIAETILQIEPENSDALEARGYARLELKDYRGAITDYSKAIDKNPLSPESYFRRGLARQQSHDPGGAREDYERALYLDSAHGEAKASLALLSLSGAPTEIGRPADLSVLPLPAAYIHDLALPAAVPAEIKEPLDINKLTVSQYNGAVSAAMEAIGVMMGELSPEEEKQFNAQWAPLFGFPTEESIEYFNQLNPLLSEFLSLRAAIATAAVEFDGAWEEAVNAAASESENGVREALAIAEMQKNNLNALQARLSHLVKAVQSLGNPPDAQEAKSRAKKAHVAAVKVVKKMVKKTEKEQKPTSPSQIPEAIKEAEKAQKPPPAMAQDLRDKLRGEMSSELSPVQIEKALDSISQGALICRWNCASHYCEAACGDWEARRKLATECSPDQVAKQYRLCKQHGKIFGFDFPKKDDKKTVVQGTTAVAVPEEPEEEEPPVDDDLKERIAFHRANIRIIERNLSRDEQELASEADQTRRASLEWRILQGRSDMLAELDLIASLQTGQYVHTRSPFDDYAQAQFINNIKENQRRMEEYQRTNAALNRLAGMLPGDEAEGARAFIKRQLPPETMGNMDTDQARKVASALNEKVQGYYQSESANYEEKAAWASFGMEAAENIKSGADKTMFVCSLFGGKGVMVAYQGVTGYVEGGPVEAVTRAASWYSTPTYVAAQAFKGYQEDGWKGAAGNAAISYLSAKAFEYGAKQLGKQFAKATVSAGPANVPSRAPATKSPSTITVKENLELTQFKQARLQGESLAKDFSKAQAELQSLGRSGASPQEIIRQQSLVRDMAAGVHANPHAKNYLKYKGDALSQRGYNAHMKATHAEVEAGFHETMRLKGWNRQELREFRNAASAGSVGMDHDIGLVEKAMWVAGRDGKMIRNNWLVRNGQAQAVEKWQGDAQSAWNENYRRVTGRSAERSWETVTTSANLESYRDMNLLGRDKSAVQRIWAEQSADVTRYKMQHMMKDPALTYMEKIQEVSRGTAKDMDTKLIPLLQKAKPQSDLSVEALRESQRHWQKIHSVLNDFGQNKIDPVHAQRRIRELTGGKSIPEVVDEASVLLESLIKLSR